MDKSDLYAFIYMHWAKMLKFLLYRVILNKNLSFNKFKAFYKELLNFNLITYSFCLLYTIKDTWENKNYVISILFQSYLISVIRDYFRDISLWILNMIR